MAIETSGQILTAKHRGLIVWLAYCSRERILTSSSSPTQNQVAVLSENCQGNTELSHS